MPLELSVTNVKNCRVDIITNARPDYSAVIITHIPTGIQVMCDSKKTRYGNEVSAWALLDERVKEWMRDPSDMSKDKTWQT